MTHLSTGLLFAIAKRMRSHTALCCLMLAACLVVPLNTSYAQSSNQNIKKVNITPPPQASLPYWQTAPSNNIAYGIQITTLGNGTDDTPTIYIHGTKGKSRPYPLDNAADNWGDNKTEYFVIAADDIGDVGIPTDVEFHAGGDDAWRFRLDFVDFYAKEGFNMLHIKSYRNDWNNRDRVLWEQPPYNLAAAIVTNVPFGATGALSGERETYDVVYDSPILFSARGVVPQPAHGSTQNVTVSNQYIIVDARHSPSPIPWNSTQETRVSGEEVLRALQSQSSTTGVSNTLTVTMEASAKASVPGAELSSKVSVSNALTVSHSKTSGSQDEQQQKLSQTFSDRTGQTYTINPGDVAFFALTKTAEVTSYPTFDTESVLRRISPKASVSYNLNPTYFRTECGSGELKLLNVSYDATGREAIFSLGAALRDASQQRFLAAARQAWSNFSTHMANTPCQEPKDAPSAGAPSVDAPLAFEYTRNFENVWDDAGSGADRDVGFFRPIPPQGYHILGHYAHASHATPTADVLVVKEEQPGALAAPVDYDRIWTDAGSGADRDAAVWWPSCPGNYVALGLVTTSGAKPSTDAVRCVREDLTVPAEVGEQIWIDRGSGAREDFGAWRVRAKTAPAGETYVAPGTFIGHASHSTISSANARALKKSGR